MRRVFSKAKNATDRAEIGSVHLPRPAVLPNMNNRSVATTALSDKRGYRTTLAVADANFVVRVIGSFDDLLPVGLEIVV
jgi:hypothetical protein